MMTFWGLKNCDTCRKARKWLDQQGIDYSFKDVRADKPDHARLKHWIDEAGLDVLINRRGTTWRNLPDELKKNISPANAIDLLCDYPALMKRPIIETGQKLYVGFSADIQKQLM